MQFQPLLGGCQCGSVRYKIVSRPTKPLVCHCRMCQKASGAPFMAFAEVDCADLSWESSPPTWFRSSEGAERGFCSNCGTSLHFRYVDGNKIDVAIASFDRANAVVPDQQVGCESRLNWLDRFDWLPSSKTEDTTPPEALARYTSRQHSDE